MSLEGLRKKIEFLLIQILLVEKILLLSSLWELRNSASKLRLEISTILIYKMLDTCNLSVGEFYTV